MLILYWGFNGGDLNVWENEGNAIWDKFALRLNIGGEMFHLFYLYWNHMLDMGWLTCGVSDLA